MSSSVWLSFPLWVLGFLIFNPSANASVAPIEGGKFEHAPYADRVCSLCHERDDVKNPGKINGTVNALCFSCHTDHEEEMTQSPHPHGPAVDSCTHCHNPHNGNFDKFLSNKTPDLCLDCHSNIGEDYRAAKAQHGAVMFGSNCANCHNPHAAKIEKLLKALPYDLCVNCHSRDDMVDEKGRKLTNIKKLLETRPNKHGPVAEKDCASCHMPHSGPNFRLLVADYPSKFYSPYDPNNYSLCFTCHDSAIVDQKETVNLTEFRDGKRNLHYLHVNKSWGRTCRACHEVHAAESPHIIRDGVPYGNSGYVLKINFEKLPEGGRCSKTCHTTKEYRR